VLIQVSGSPTRVCVSRASRSFRTPSRTRRGRSTSLSLEVEKEGVVVFVRGDLEARVPLHCGRCLEFYTVTVHRPSMPVRARPGQPAEKSGS